MDHKHGFVERAPNFSIERKLCIDVHRINYVYQKLELQRYIAYVWENKIIMSTFRFSSGKRLQNHDAAATLIPSWKAEVKT